MEGGNLSHPKKHNVTTREDGQTPHAKARTRAAAAPSAGGDQNCLGSPGRLVSEAQMQMRESPGGETA